MSDKMRTRGRRKHMEREGLNVLYRKGISNWEIHMPSQLQHMDGNTNKKQIGISILQV